MTYNEPSCSCCGLAGHGGCSPPEALSRLGARKALRPGMADSQVYGRCHAVSGEEVLEGKNDGDWREKWECVQS